MSARCKSCGAEIIWATSPTGAAIPLDRSPVSPAHHYLFEPLTEQASRVMLHVSHFTTCPDATSHSRKRAK